jgi:hypothetical protein
LHPIRAQPSVPKPSRSARQSATCQKTNAYWLHVADIDDCHRALLLGAPYQEDRDLAASEGARLLPSIPAPALSLIAVSVGASQCYPTAGASSRSP